MSKPTSTISSAVSIRVSNDLLDSIREYAIAHNLINNSGRPDKRGEPNLSQAFSELVRLGLGQDITVSDSVSNAVNNDLRDTVTKLSDSVSILSDKLEERDSRLEAVLNQVEDLRLKVHSQETYSLLYDHLKADVDIRFDATNKAIAALTSKAKVSHEKAPDTITETESDSNAEITGEVIEPDGLPIIEVVKTIAAPSIENPLPTEGLSDAIAATAKAKNITYRLNHDGSVVLRSLKGIGFRDLKRMNDQQLKEIGLFKTLIGKDEKFFPVDPDTIVATAKPKATKKQSTKVDTGKRFTSMAAAAYYRQKTGQPLKETTLIANAKKYGFVIKEKGSGLYALIDES
jgi:hypothetical protein